MRYGLLTKNPSLSSEEFRHHWKNEHGPLAIENLPGLISYSQNHVIDNKQIGIDVQRGAVEFDGFSALEFDSQESMLSNFSGKLSEALINDEDDFLEQVIIVGAERFTVIEPPTTGKFVKRMSLLTRIEGVSDEQFRHEWIDVHPEHVREIPGVLGYRQNLINHRENPKGNIVDRQGFNYDGIVELWFESPETIEEGFRSPNGLRTMKHSENFLAQITAFLVEEITIK